MKKKVFLIIVGIVVIMSSLAYYLQTQGYHYPCVRCDPHGVIVTP